MEDRLLHELVEFSSLVGDFCVPRPSVERLDRCEFETEEEWIDRLRSFVSSNQPVLLSNAFSHWNAMQRWTNEYLSDRLGSSLVTVAFSPDGRSDAIHGDRFVLPAEERLSFRSFLRIFEGKDTKIHGVPYIQYQNGSFLSEYESLWEDVDVSPLWANALFGHKNPDAVNLWMGDSRSVSSLHKDHYENIYVVIAGTKKFTLFPPADQPFLYEREFPVSRFVKHTDADSQMTVFDIVDCEAEDQVPWMQINPDMPDFDRFPLYQYAHPIQVSVSAGECLYLPSMWYHQVSQENDTDGRCIAVNFWYDMDFGDRYCYFSLIEKLGRILHS